MNQQHDDARTPLPSSTAAYGTLESPASDAEPEAFPGERAIARTVPGSRDEMRVIRRHYTWVNMVIALVACMALAVLALMFAPQQQGDPTREVDYVQVAQNAQPGADFALSVPAAEEGWYSNAARLDTEGAAAVLTWYVNWVDTENSEWVSIRQVPSDASESWSAGPLDGFVSSGSSEIAGVEFERFEYSGGSRHALLGTAEDSQLLVMGSTSWTHVEDRAAAAVESAREAPASAEAAAEDG